VTVLLNGRVILVTGTTSGIGRGIAILFAQRGAEVVGMARRAEIGKSLERELDGHEGSFSFVQGDITHPDDCSKAVALTIERHGRVDVLINNAANTLPTGRIEETTDEEWIGTLEPGLRGTFNMCRAALPAMQRQQDGTIINVSSYAGIQGLSKHGAYGAAKAGVIQLTKVLAVENVEHGVRANAVIMGSVETEGWKAARASMSEEWDTVKNGTDPPTAGGPLAAMKMQTEDVAKAIALLCTEDARCINGSTLAIDRGYSAGWHFSTMMKLGVSGQLPNDE
jgi:NAD(P)-dependent dehydrogenase (short-subunit alcohol dehydrogenase family)